MLLLLVRFAIFCLVVNCACFAFSSSALRDEEPVKISGSTIIPKGGADHSAPNGSSTYIFSKITESRGGSEGRKIAQISKEFPYLSLPFGQKSPEPPLHGITNTLEQLRTETATGNTEQLIYRTSLLDNVNGRPLIKTMEYPWEDSSERDKLFLRCLIGRKSPAYVFRYMHVNLMYSRLDIQSIDPKLIWWFDYVKRYRGESDAGTINTGTSHTASSRTATSHGVFDDEKLFSLLVDELDLQTARKDMSLAVVIFETPPSALRQQVVTLFELLRGEPTMKNLAEEMQLYLISDAETRPLVVQAWLQAQVSPATIFTILSVGDKLGQVGFVDNAVFTLWLEYVVKYWERVSPGSAPFRYSMFFDLLQANQSPKRVQEVLKSKAFHFLVERVRPPGTANHASILQAQWILWLWLSRGATPQNFFRFLNPSGEFNLGNSKSVMVFTFIDLYRKKKSFSNEEVFNMLSSANSVEDMVELFRWLQEKPLLHDLAIGMLEYISTDTKVAEMTPDEYWRSFLSKDLNYTKDDPLLLNWVQHAVSYFMRVKNESREHAVSDVIKLLQEIEPNRHAVVLMAHMHDSHKRKRWELL